MHGYSLAGFQYEDDCFCGEESLEDLIEFKVNDMKCDWRWGDKKKKDTIENDTRTKKPLNILILIMLIWIIIPKSNFN